MSTEAQPAEGILIEGVSNLPVTLARCCKPAPPDAIVGYATQGRGVTVHRRDCANIQRIRVSVRRVCWRRGGARRRVRQRYRGQSL